MIPKRAKLFTCTTDHTPSQGVPIGRKEYREMTDAEEVQAKWVKWLVHVLGYPFDVNFGEGYRPPATNEELAEEWTRSDVGSPNAEDNLYGIRLELDQIEAEPIQ